MSSKSQSANLGFNETDVLNALRNQDSTLVGAALETIVDAYGMRRVLDALADVAALKCEYVATNWQDKSVARLWAQTQAQLSKLAARIPDPLFTDKQIKVQS